MSTDKDVNTEIKGVISEIKALKFELKAFRKDMNTKFTWLYGLVIVSILIPLVSKFIPALH
ncbi:hypothetical protein [Cysteiniphilum sp. JM-1]|uniref:hypothetical protein n=1 Tax=Cysteiniphilum sp. JM-1 TaxID=2610891 RepID=UPI001248239A|nr:hypothetical protein [Cysteiniphilum sp. JM-1]